MRILIIDDDHNIAEFLKTNFESELFAVDVATDGENGALLGRSNDYDLIILDNVLPGKMGSQVCQEIREKNKEVKIIMLSALSDITTKVNLLDIGADDYMTKPFSFQELLARVRALLRRPNTAIDDEIFKVGALEIDMKNAEVKKNGKPINLTRKEYMLLEFLAKNAGKTLTQLEIMDHVWDNELDSFSNTLKSHIRNLRAKIDGGRKTSFVQTVNGRGYRLNTE